MAKSLVWGVSRLGFAEGLLYGDVRKQCDQLHLNGEQWRWCGMAEVVFHHVGLITLGQSIGALNASTALWNGTIPNAFQKVRRIQEDFKFANFCDVATPSASAET